MYNINYFDNYTLHQYKINKNDIFTNKQHY